MSGSKNKHILRMMCMTMLMLIHCDVYAYELMTSFLHEQGTELAQTQGGNDALAEETDEDGIKWNDPVYKHTPSSHRLLVKALPVVIVAGFMLLPPKDKSTCPPVGLSTEPAYRNQPSRLAYCTLQI